MGDPSSPSFPPGPGSAAADKLPDASEAPPPLLDGIVRVKVPADKIQRFLAKSALFKSCDKTVVGKVAPPLQGLECAEGSELVTAGKVNDGIGILFSGKAQVLMPGPGGELIPVEDVQPGDHFGEVSALLGRPSPYFVIAAEPTRVLWLPSTTAQSLIANVPAVGEAISKRLSERLVLFAGIERHAQPEVMTDLESQLLETVNPGIQAQPVQTIHPEPDDSGVIAFHELRDFDLSPSVLSMVPSKLVRNYRFLPVRLQGNVLTLAMVNPRDNAALAELRRTLATVEIRPVAIGLEDFNSAIVRLKLDDSGAKGRATP